MMDIQKLMEVISSTAQDGRKDYHLLLGKFMDILEQNPDMEVMTDRGKYIYSPNSYRGYYSDLSIGETDEVIIASKLFNKLNNDVLDKYLTGYKGGENLMDRKTPIWIADYGDCGLAAVKASVVDGKIIVETKETDD